MRVCVCVFTCVYLCVRIYMCVCVCIHVYLHAYMCEWVCVPVRMCVYRVCVLYDFVLWILDTGIEEIPNTRGGRPVLSD